MTDDKHKNLWFIRRDNKLNITGPDETNIFESESGRWDNLKGMAIDIRSNLGNDNLVLREAHLIEKPDNDTKEMLLLNDYREIMKDKYPNHFNPRKNRVFGKNSFSVGDYPFVIDAKEEEIEYVKGDIFSEYRIESKEGLSL